MPEALRVFAVFLKLGCTAFGGPVAHLAYFRNEFVLRRTWVSDETFAQCVALTQLLPGPASSQTGILLGWLRAGPLGALAAWAAFTLPSAVLMTAVALASLHLSAAAGALHGMLAIAVGVVAAAIVAMRTTLAPDSLRLAVAAAAAVVLLLLPYPAMWALVVIAGALLGVSLGATPPLEAQPLSIGVSRPVAVCALTLYAVTTAFALLWTGNGSLLGVCAALYGVGASVFGGGHVVLPVLHAVAVARGFVDDRTLLAGYGAAQAMPGPLFSIGAYIGATAKQGAFGITGAAAGTAAIFAPSFLLVAGIAPFYTSLRASALFRRALAGANAAVLGI